MNWTGIMAIYLHEMDRKKNEERNIKGKNYNKYLKKVSKK
jgi:hypothetical protein